MWTDVRVRENESVGTPVSGERSPATQLTLASLNIPLPSFVRSEGETENLKRVIASLFGLSSSSFGLKVLPHPENWACGFSPDTEQRIREELSSGSLDLERMTDEQFTPDAFYYPLKELQTRPEQEVFGLVHHEAAHAQHTSFRLLLLGHKLAEVDGKLPTTWGLLLNGVEDGRINRLKSEESDATAAQLSALYQSWEKDVLKGIGAQSLVRQYALNAVHCWLRGVPIPSGLDERVQSAFEATKDDVFRYIREDGREQAHAILRDSIWPKVKHLEDEAQKDQALRDQRDGNRSFWQRLKDLMQRNSAEESVGEPLTQDERKELQKEFDKLSDEEKKELLDKASKKLDKRQAEEANKDGPKGFSYELDEKSGTYKLSREKTPDEADKRLSKQMAEDAHAEARQKEAAENLRHKKLFQMQRDGFTEKQEEQFDEFNAIRSSIIALKNGFVRKLRGIVPRETMKDFGGEFHSGPRIDIGKLVRRAPVKDARFYQRRNVEVSGDPLLAVEVIIDNSGSMEGEKMEQARRAVLLTLETLSALELPTCVKKFDEGYEWIQSREQQYRDAGARVKPRFLEGLSGKGSATNIGAPLEETKDALAAFKLRHPSTLCLVIVVTDGGANRGRTGASLLELIADIQRKAVVVNINLCGTHDQMRESEGYFGAQNVVGCKSASELPDVFIRVLRGAFDRALRRNR